jgi:hypothetical protein
LEFVAVMSPLSATIWPVANGRAPQNAIFAVRENYLLCKRGFARGSAIDFLRETLRLHRCGRRLTPGSIGQSSAHERPEPLTGILRLSGAEFRPQPTCGFDSRTRCQARSRSVGKCGQMYAAHTGFGRVLIWRLQKDVQRRND